MVDDPHRWGGPGVLLQLWIQVALLVRLKPRFHAAYADRHIIWGPFAIELGPEGRA